MRTSVEALENNRFKLTVEVDDEEVARAEAETLGRFAREARIPGFRPGRVPRRLLEARLGAKTIREQALRDALPRLYGEAVKETELDVIAAPKIDVTSGDESGPVAFDAVVEVRPEVSIPGYEGLVVTVPSPSVTGADVDAQIDRLREQFASLNEVDRPARDGDLVTLDVHGSRDGKPADGLVADDLVYPVGTDGIAEGVDELLAGAKVGDIFEMDADDAPGGPAHLRLLVKQVREKVLPAAGDEFASDASEFESLAELREDLAARLSVAKRRQAGALLRAGALDALAELVADEIPEVLVAQEAQVLLEDFTKRLAAQKVLLSTYLEVAGIGLEKMLDDLKAQARREVRADLALRALVAAEEIEVDESELDEEIVHLAGHAGQTPARMRLTIDRGGGLGGLRSQLRRAKALSWLIEHVAIVDEEGNPVNRAALTVDEADSDAVREESDQKPPPDEVGEAEQ
ncbi:MAG: trigger factor [Acidimicrobiales bacterium]|jgi:trigger factor